MRDETKTKLLEGYEFQTMLIKASIVVREAGRAKTYVEFLQTHQSNERHINKQMIQNLQSMNISLSGNTQCVDAQVSLLALATSGAGGTVSSSCAVLVWWCHALELCYWLGSS